MKLTKNSINLAVNEIQKIYQSKTYKNYLINNSSKLKLKIDRNSVVKKVLKIYEQL